MAQTLREAIQNGVLKCQGQVGGQFNFPYSMYDYITDEVLEFLEEKFGKELLERRSSVIDEAVGAVFIKIKEGK